MAFLFGGEEYLPKHSNTPKNPVRDTQNDIRNAMRTLQRESLKTVRTEKELMAAIKRFAQINKLQLATLKAKELVRLRAHQERLEVTHCQLATLHQTLSTIASTQVMHESLAKTTKMFQNLRTTMNPASIMKTMRQFQVESEYFQTAQEQMHESVDDALQVEDEQSITQETVGQVFQELGLDLGKLMEKSGTPQAVLPAVDEEDLEKRFQRLKTSMKT